MEENTIIAKRGRGRPKGSTRKATALISKPIEDINTTDDETSSEKDAEETHTTDFDLDFLSDLNNRNYKDHVEEPKPISKPKMKAVSEVGETYTEKYCKNLFEKAERGAGDFRQGKKDSFKGLFSNKPTEIIGKDKRVLLSKLNQYKLLFPEQLKTFKIKPNSSIEELQSALKEAEIIVETNNLETFLTDSILQSLKVIEGGSTLTKYDISGLSDALKKNEQFHSLVKQLYVKYSVFSKVPAEYSLVILVSTTAYTCFIINQRKKELNRFLDEPVPSRQ